MDVLWLTDHEHILQEIVVIVRKAVSCVGSQNPIAGWHMLQFLPDPTVGGCQDKVMEELGKLGDRFCLLRTTQDVAKELDQWRAKLKEDSSTPIPHSLLPLIPQGTAEWLTGRDQFIWNASSAYMQLGMTDVSLADARALKATAHDFLNGARGALRPAISSA